MGLQDLTHVHAARHAERVEDNVDRGAVLGIGHVLHRNDLRDHALVAVSAGHLVARLQLAFHRNEDLHHLHHARRQFIAALQLVDLVLEPLGQLVDGLVELLVERLDIALALVVLHRDLAPLAGREVGQDLLGDLGAG